MNVSGDLVGLVIWILISIEPRCLLVRAKVRVSPVAYGTKSELT
jgi:hypothetical protein